MKPSKFFQFLLFFVGIWAVLNLLNGTPKEENLTNNQNDIVISSIKSKFSQGNVVQIKIKNNKTEVLHAWQDCPSEPLDVYRWENGEWLQINSLNANSQCNTQEIITTGETKTVDYSDWNYELFNTIGKYKIVYQDGKKEFPVEFEIKTPSFFGQIWNSLFYKPIYNALIFISSILPGHNLGWAVVLVTILIKILLIAPNHKALKAQKALQKVQPELDQIKKKYAGDQQKIAQETMAIWKKHKVNPLGSCLPMLIQFPIMIALFYVVKVGLAASNIHLLYAPLKDFDLNSINIIFLGFLDLTQVNVFLLPLIVGGLQFAQMKLSFSAKQKKNEEKANAQMDQMQAMNKMMTYSLPIMIAFFTATMPAAVGLYWGVSTLFGILQQIYINKKH